MAFKPSYDPETGRFKVLVRLSFCKIFEKTASFENGSLKYRTNGLIYKSTPEGEANTKVVNQALSALVKKEWPARADDIKKFRALCDDGPKGRWAMHDGDKYFNDEGDVRDGYADIRYLKLTNDRKVKIRDRRGQDVEEDDKFELFQSGHWAIAHAHLFAIKDTKKGGNGVFTTLNALQFFKRDEVFAGGGIPDDEIEDYGDDEDDDLGGSDAGKDDDLGDL
jgi:hypothetical protein